MDTDTECPASFLPLGVFGLQLDALSFAVIVFSLWAVHSNRKRVSSQPAEANTGTKQPSSAEQQNVSQHILDCYARRKWEEVASWIAGGGATSHHSPSALHYAILFNAPDRIVKSILHLAHVRTRNGETALHFAIRLRSPHCRLLVEAVPGTLGAADTAGNSPLGLVWENQLTLRNHRSGTNATWTKILEMLRWYAQSMDKRNCCAKQGILMRGSKDTTATDATLDAFSPLHITAGLFACPQSLFEFGLEQSSGRDSVAVCDDGGRTPLHWACSDRKSNQYAEQQNRGAMTACKIHTLLQVHQQAANVHEKRGKGRLALHMALDSGILWKEGVEQLANSTTVSWQRDPLTGLPTFTLAKDVATAYEVLRRDPQGQIAITKPVA